MRTIARIYDSYEVARNVVTELEAAGIPHSDISLIANAGSQGTGTGSGATDSSLRTPGDRIADYDTTRSTASYTDTGTTRAPHLTDRTTTADVTGGGTQPADPAAPDDSNAGAGAKRGAVAGTAVGGGLGLLAGIGALAIPGVGPVVAAGWLVATLAGAGVGAGAGGLLGALTGAGVGEEESHVYAEGVRRGGSLVSVRVPDGREAEVAALMAPST